MVEIKYNNKSFLFFIALFAMLPPFAINTYAPAIPEVAKYFHVSESKVLLTATTYFIGFSIGMLFWGPISDRFGRKIPLFIGMILYVISTIMCAMSNAFSMLELMRFLQGLSDCSGAVISLSILRDCYSGKKLNKSIAVMAIIMMIAPIISPIVGTVLLKFTGHWQSEFHFLSFYGIFLLIVTYFLTETLDKKDRTTAMHQSIGFYYAHVCNTKFVFKTLSSGLCFAAFFSFIGSAPIIFLHNFNSGYLAYCISFGVCVFGVILANTFITFYNHIISVKQFALVGIISTMFGIVVYIILISITTHIVICFTIGMTITLFGLSLTSSILLSDSLNHIEKGFGSANSISNFIKYGSAGIANYVMSQYPAKGLVHVLSLQQFLIIFVILIIMLLVWNKEGKISRA
ncbi:multidrug effflux MFS transporter [Francisellaceae bacterium]|nr:multidrug effflux MFS transporter [Francisellaceae bacterium]